ncbi:predicted protein [Botrytis cinerea T4]|uniref:Uncharacterized protein n=1 Tax=Botryotinia fuckeliana (strain T4) TaxID=999810 RepID=G2Y8M4_BOTF4|nr:predicted protein [Botrytis cinerea T4]
MTHCYPTSWQIPILGCGVEPSTSMISSHLTPGTECHEWLRISNFLPNQASPCGKKALVIMSNHLAIGSAVDRPFNHRESSICTIEHPEN